ncbi:uncharacterized protein LOC141848949 [Brevipalpus obovatus]|uniref:uncharacterized protein LOC141848949 n=1 Tax=Brevipalpus obovatus TaxID=246614 RepID=UPI003D9DE8AF
MDIVLLHSHIIQRIFDFSGPQDVCQCRYVCKTFHHEASRWLTRCPSIDAFQSVVRVIKMRGRRLFESKSPGNERAVMEVFMKNEEMNAGSRRLWDQCEQLGWWYLKRKDNFRHLSRPRVEKALKNFLKEGMDCLPSFSFIHTDYDQDHLMSSNSFQYPTIAVIHRSNLDIEFELDDEILRTPIRTLLDIPEDSHLLEHLNSYIVPFIDAIHINRYAPDHKVILTNWQDPENMRPNLDDPEYPVKALMFFTGYLVKNDPEEEIDQFLEEFTSPVMYCDFGYISLFYFNPLEDVGLIESHLISVAFAGKQIKSAMHVFHKYADQLEFSQQVLEFKNSLDFRTDDGRVFGFLAHAAGPIYDPIGKYFNRLIEILGSVKFVNILVENISKQKFCSNHPAILVIRI